jgi:hypothetical protein
VDGGPQVKIGIRTPQNSASATPCTRRWFKRHRAKPHTVRKPTYQAAHHHHVVSGRAEATAPAGRRPRCRSKANLACKGGARQGTAPQGMTGQACAHEEGPQNAACSQRVTTVPRVAERQTAGRQLPRPTSPLSPHLCSAVVLACAWLIFHCHLPGQTAWLRLACAQTGGQRSSPWCRVCGAVRRATQCCGGSATALQGTLCTASRLKVLRSEGTAQHRTKEA